MASRRKKRQVGRTLKATKSLERQYQTQLFKLGRGLVQAVREQVLPFLKNSERTYAADSVSGDLNVIFSILNRQFSGAAVLGFARQSAEEFVGRADRQSEMKFNESVRGITGVDLGSVISSEKLNATIETNIANNVNLITSLPEEYLKSVETIVYNGVASGARYSTIQQQILAKVGSANSKLAGRIKTIARDQMQTITSQLNLRRSQALGITKGIYRTSEDERVRPCHAELNGKEYELAKGAWSSKCQKFIQPGITDINCRCGYSPVIEV